MPKHFFRNPANITVLVRVALVFVVMVLLDNGNGSVRLLSVAALAVALALDGLDGYLARKLKIASGIGGALDTLGDRITENALIVFFAYKQLLPLWFALYFLVRSFMADFIRGLNFRKGISTFAINDSFLGKMLVSSKISRVAYLIAKFLLFITASALLARKGPRGAAGTMLHCLFWIVFLFNLLRFLALLNDSRRTIKEHFYHE
jgi:CDP-diacylglycerol--glycerol-3-phosphate 3-phosphatidyltransferase